MLKPPLSPPKLTSTPSKISTMTMGESEGTSGEFYEEGNVEDETDTKLLSNENILGISPTPQKKKSI